MQVCTVVFGTFSAPTGTFPLSCSLSGAKIGDIVLGIWTGTAPFGSGSVYNTWFESTISVDNQVQKIGGPDLTADNPLTAILLHPIC